MVELMLPFLCKESTIADQETKNDVIVDIKLLMLRSYNKAIYVHEYQNQKCTMFNTPEYRFVEEITNKERIDVNLQESMQKRSVDLESKFY